AMLFAFGRAIVGGDHASLGAVHEQPDAAAFFLETLPERTDQIRTENPLTGADHFRMDRVVDEGGKRFAIRADGLDDVATRVVQLLSVIVIGDLSLRLASSDFEADRLE